MAGSARMSRTGNLDTLLWENTVIGKLLSCMAVTMLLAVSAAAQTAVEVPIKVIETAGVGRAAGQVSRPPDCLRRRLWSPCAGLGGAVPRRCSPALPGAGLLEALAEGGVLGSKCAELMGELYLLTGDEKGVQWARGSIARWEKLQDKSDNPRRRGNWFAGGMTSYTWEIGNALIHVPALLGYLDELDRAKGNQPVLYDTTQAAQQENP